MEVERLRRKTAEEQRRGDDGDGDVDEVEVVRPAPPPPPRPAPRPRPRRVEPQVLEVVPAPPPAPPRPAPTPSAYDQPMTAAGPQVALVARPAEIALIARPAEIATVRTAGQGGKAITQVSRDVIALLHSKQVQSAILLSEILGPPKSKRRRR
jgi:hypothetical protein